MSMLTAQCDKLRETAADLREHSTFVGFGGVVNRDPVLIDAARQMEDAADTIMGLRDRLTDTKEVETCHNVGFAPYFFECSECGKTHLRNAAYVDMPNYCPECGRKVVG